MEPRIQYAKTTDGVSIAFSTLGEGPPLVTTPFIPSHIELLWQTPYFRRVWELLARGRRVVYYDSRGSGLSQRDVADFSLDALVRDLEAVVDRLQLERFALMGVVHTGPAAIAYAVRHPDRVTHLMLWHSWAAGSEVMTSPLTRGAQSLIDTDWSEFADTLGFLWFGLSEAEQGQHAATLVRESIGPQDYKALITELGSHDVSDLLSKVPQPTLVLHPRQSVGLQMDVVRKLTSQIPNARLAVSEGRLLALSADAVEAVGRAIDEFLGEGKGAAQADAGALPEGTAVILFTDIADSTALTEQLGDSAFRAKARELDESLRAVIREAGGAPVEGKVLGDGVMAVFTSARQAIDCALRCDAAAKGTGLHLHLGVHAGDVIREGNTVYGGAVNIAARIAGASSPGEILVSDIVRGLARTSANVVFEGRGERELKGVGEPQRLFAVRGVG